METPQQPNMDPIQILQNSENISIRYRVLTELLGREKSDPEIREIEARIPESKSIQKIFSKMHPEGYWLQKNPRTKRVVGEGVEYGSFATTHYVLSYLMEFGLTRDHEIVERAAERYLNLQSSDGDFWLYMSCLNGLNIRTFSRLGYNNDPRILKTLDLMLNTRRSDYGYLCKMHEKRSKRKKSCYRGSLKMLMAFAEFPEVWNHPRCLELVEYFTNRKGIFNSKRVHYVNKDMERITFPITWGSNNWELLLTLSRMGYGKDPKLNEAWELLDSRLDENGFYPIDYFPSQIPIKVGQKKQANEWITFYVLLAKKYRDSQQFTRNKKGRI